MNPRDELKSAEKEIRSEFRKFAKYVAEAQAKLIAGLEKANQTIEDGLTRLEKIKKNFS